MGASELIVVERWFWWILTRNGIPVYQSGWDVFATNNHDDGANLKGRMPRNKSLELILAWTYAQLVTTEDLEELCGWSRHKNVKLVVQSTGYERQFKFNQLPRVWTCRTQLFLLSTLHKPDCYFVNCFSWRTKSICSECYSKSWGSYGRWLEDISELQVAAIWCQESWTELLSPPNWCSPQVTTRPSFRNAEKADRDAKISCTSRSCSCTCGTPV